MTSLKCRNCAAEISSDTRVTRCKGCGTLFPFACAVCERSLRPPFPVYSDERYLNAGEEPLCHDHFQRQCPSCKTWFQANENSGYFMCKMCLEVREASIITVPESRVISSPPAIAMDVVMPSSFPQWDQDLVSVREEGGARDLATTFLFATVCLAMIAVIGVLVWQVISLLRLMTGA